MSEQHDKRSNGGETRTARLAGTRWFGPVRRSARCLSIIAVLAGSIGFGWHASGQEAAVGSGFSPSSTVRPPVQNAVNLATERAREHIRRGLELGGRHAVYSAQIEFTQALRLIAGGLDLESGGREREAALEAGLRALDSVDSAKSNSTALVPAMQQQLANAQERLAFCGAHVPEASMSLYALGRAQVAAVDEAGEDPALAGPKAVAFYQAALAVDPANFLAANELTVLFVRYGQLAEAERVLTQAVSITPRPELWRNLSVIYEKMGNVELSRQARKQHDDLVAALKAKGEPVGQAQSIAANIRWTDPVEFARSVGGDEFDSPPSERAAGSPPPQAAKASPPPKKKSGLPLPEWLTVGLRNFDKKPSTTQIR
jgi:hypothetical protein